MNRLVFTSLAQRGTFGILVFLLSSTLAYGATYYVRTDGNNANAGTSNAAGGAWRTIDFAANSVAAGDVVRVQAGTYSEIVNAGRNGSSGNTITFVADGTATVCGWNFANSSYIRVIGFVIDSNAGCTARDRTVQMQGTNSYLELWHNIIRDGGDGIGMPSITDRVNNSLIIGNTLTDLGTSRAFGYCATGMATQGTHTLFAYNAIGPIDCDAFAVNGTFNGLPQGSSVTAAGKSFTISYTGGTGNDVVLTAASPTAVSVPGFNARRSFSGVVLTWRTGSVGALLGFNVWCGTRKLNGALISGRAAAGDAEHRFVDRRPPARRAVYRLEIVGLDGSRTFRAARA